MKKTFLLVLILIISTVSLFGCGNKEVIKEEIKFGVLPAEGAIPIIVAYDKGYFEKEGLKVEVVPFNSPNERNIAVQAGKIDGIIADIMTSLTYHDAGFNMKITSDINEDFKLLTAPNSGIDSFEKLNNKEVSLVPNFVLEYIMDEMAKENNIKYKTVVIPSIPTRFEALLSNQVDSVIFTEPQASMLSTRGANVLASSNEYGIKAGAILFNEKVTNENKQAIKAFYRGYNKAVEYINNKDAKEYSKVLTNYGFPNTIKEYLNNNSDYKKANKLDDETFKSVLKWTKSKGIVKKDYTFEDISNFSFIK
ncbi:MAG: transporter substrate-binding domain-containing protein [Firmicutes bacterium]|nr:transporter substrate-binding domain-containing protein [Bacillota bacterium]